MLHFEYLNLEKIFCDVVLASAAILKTSGIRTSVNRCHSGLNHHVYSHISGHKVVSINPYSLCVEILRFVVIGKSFTKIRL